MPDEIANRERCISRIASAQHGVISIAQLREAGLAKQTVTDRVASGRLHRVHRGVYAVGHSSLSFEGRCKAAVLAHGSTAAVSHRTAAELWGMLRAERGPVHLTVASEGGRSRQVGIELHRSRTLEPVHVTSRSGIAVTGPPRTLRDCHRVLSRSLYLRAVRRSLDLRLISEDQLRSGEEITRSELERRFLALCRRHGIPQPLVNTKIGKYEADFLWVDHRLIVETDGWGTHGDRASFEADRARDVHLQAMGYRVLRLTYAQVCRRPREVVEPLRRLIG